MFETRKEVKGGGEGEGGGGKGEGGGGGKGGGVPNIQLKDKTMALLNSQMHATLDCSVAIFMLSQI